MRFFRISICHHFVATATFFRRLWMVTPLSHNPRVEALYHCNIGPKLNKSSFGRLCRVSGCVSEGDGEDRGLEGELGELGRAAGLGDVIGVVKLPNDAFLIVDLQEVLNLGGAVVFKGK